MLNYKTNSIENLIDELLKEHLCVSCTRGEVKKQQTLEYNVVTGDACIDVIFKLPGFDKGDVSVKLDGSHILIKSVDTENSKKNPFAFPFDSKYVVHEKYDVDNIEVTLYCGVLKLHIPFKKGKQLEFKIN